MTRPQAEADALPFPVLIGDVGGTNARFALLAGPHAQPSDIAVFETAAYDSVEEAIAIEVLARSALKPRSALLALAGPIGAEETRLTNGSWTVRPGNLIERLGLSDVLLVNDFEAQALAVAACAPERMERIGAGAGDPDASRVVLGPGTGLGVAGLLRVRGMWVPVPGEGGHVDIGPKSAREHAIWPHLERVGGRVSAEQILAGPGLVNLYRAVSKAEGGTPALASPAEVSTAGLAGTDRAAAEALEIFVSCLGRFAGDMALIFLSRGGVFLTGGITARILPAMKRDTFRAAFEDKAPYRALLASMPVHVVTDPLAPLSGLAAFARQPELFGVETKGRRWSAS